jgi:hypothetical protein
MSTKRSLTPYNDLPPHLKGRYTLMKRKFGVPALALTLVLTSIPVLHADVKTEEKSLVTFSGMLGRMMNLFGGKAAKEGVVSTVAVSGERKMNANDARGQIVDLKEETIYDLDMRKKTYTVTTFEELRRKMEEMEAKAKADAAKAPKEEQPENQGKQMEIDFDVKSTGQTKNINGFDTREVVITVTAREKGRKLEDSGGMVMTVDNWLTKSQPALKEISDFDRRYYQSLAGPTVQIDAQQLATAMAMMPGLKESFARVNKETLDGTAIQSTTTVEAVKSAEQMKQEQSGAGSSDQSNPASVGGAIGGFMKRRAQANAEKNGNSPRTTFMTINNEVLRISTAVSAADVAIPAGFKLSR